MSVSDAAPRSVGALPLLAASWWRVVVVLVLVGLFAWVPGQRGIGPVDRDEARYAQASKQMLETGDFIDIRLQDEPRHKKPIGIYWLQAASATLIGNGPESPLWVYRLPSLVGALVAILLTAGIAGSMARSPETSATGNSSMDGRAVGLIAGVALATTVLMGVEARLAKTDAVLLACLLTTQWALWEVWRRRDDPAGSGSWWLVFWLAQASAVLVKMPIGPMLSGLTALALCALDRRIDWIWRLRPIRGVAVFAMIVLPWFIAITLMTEGGFFQGSWGTDILGKVTQGQESHGAPPGSYVAAFWLTAWPMAFLAPLAAVYAWRHRHDDRVRFLAAWIVPFWIAFEVFVTKLPHYVLPTYPAIAILVALALMSLQKRRALVTVPLIIAAILGSGLAVAAWILPGLVGVALPWEVIGGTMIATALLALAIKDYRSAAPWRTPITAVGAVVVLYATIYGGLFPKLTPIWLSQRLADTIQAAQIEAGCIDGGIGSVGYNEPSGVFLIGTDLALLGPEEAAAWLNAEPCRLVAVSNEHDETFRAAVGNVEAVDSVYGWRLNGGKWMTLTLYRPSAA